MRDRRDVLKMLGLGVVYVSGLPGCGGPPANGSVAVTGANGRAPRAKDFYFVQVSDTHWGFRGPANPEADAALGRAIAQINALTPAPDFVVFTGDITHTTDDATVRRERMREAKKLIDELRVKNVRFIPGEHDASPDGGEAFREIFGELHWTFDHGGVHFVGLDNVSDPASVVGDAQRAWLKADLARVAASQPVIVFAHRPLFALYPAWDWHTKDGQEVLDLLTAVENVTVFYGHIHQEHHHVTGRIAHHAARSLIFPLPAPGSVAKRAPLPWDPQAKDHGLGVREVVLEGGAPHAKELPLA
jgi:hypothetical protein